MASKPYIYIYAAPSYAPLILISKRSPERPKSYIYIRRTIIRTTFGDPTLDIKSGDVLRHHVMVDQHFSGVSPQGVVFSPFQVPLLRPPRNSEIQGGSTHPPRTTGSPPLNRGSRFWKASALWRSKKGFPKTCTHIYIYTPHHHTHHLLRSQNGVPKARSRIYIYKPHHHTHHFWRPKPGCKIWRYVTASCHDGQTLFRCLSSEGWFLPPPDFHAPSYAPPLKITLFSTE